MPRRVQTNCSSKSVFRHPSLPLHHARDQEAQAEWKRDETDDDEWQRHHTEKRCRRFPVRHRLEDCDIGIEHETRHQRASAFARENTAGDDKLQIWSHWFFFHEFPLCVPLGSPYRVGAPQFGQNCASVLSGKVSPQERHRTTTGAAVATGVEIVPYAGDGV